MHLRLLAVLALFAALASSLGAPSGGPSHSKHPIHSKRPIRRVVIVGGTHGNEYTGVWCIKSLEATRVESLERPYPSLDVSTLLGNPAAHSMNRRFVDTDLNREFSEDKLLDTAAAAAAVGEEGLPLTVESLRAREIDAILGPKFDMDRTTDVVIDLHSTTSNMGTTVIIPEGDALMAQAAAYVLHQCNRDRDDDDRGEARVLLHTIPKRENRPNLSSTGRHGFTVEVGPVPQGVLRHDAVENTQRAVRAVLEFLERRNREGEHAILRELRGRYPRGRVPCFRSAPARVDGEMSGKIRWPSDDDNPNFPGAVVHRSLQDRDFHPIRRGDPLFVELDGSIVEYDGSHGEEVYLIFVNEGGYYYRSSGTGIGVAVKAEFDLEHGRLMDAPALASDNKDMSKEKEKEEKEECASVQGDCVE
mmetsp:Transcript_38406/g.115085  ORF Transcript_38406/g.115085 Transcript_38406/m.115085 type:complete len:418 (-) Transcript_38406:147-1400(-)